MKSNERAGYSEELWSLIHLESELVRAGAYLRVFGSLPDEQAIATAAGWAGYEFTLYGLDNAERCSVHCADVAASVRDLAIEINEKDWLGGCRQAEYELSLLE